MNHLSIRVALISIGGAVKYNPLRERPAQGSTNRDKEILTHKRNGCAFGDGRVA
jgi:hypothetical protein